VLHRADGQEVRQRLRRVQVAAVARVDDRNGRVLTGDARCSLLGVTHDDDVSVAGHRTDGVGDALALGDRAGRRFGEADHVAAEAEHGGLKAETGAGGGFVEECCEDGGVTEVIELSGRLNDLVSEVENLVELPRTEVRRVKQVPAFKHAVPPLSE
jgi:hypothetical protein